MKWLLLALIGCQADGDADYCPAPSTVEAVGCDPIPSGSRGCVGGPMIDDTQQLDPDATYPVGCKVTMPWCLGAYPNSPSETTCTDELGEPMWIHPI